MTPPVRNGMEGADSSTAAPESAPAATAGGVPFRFACHRCGHCCTAGDGYVWLAPGELERLAGHFGAEADAFRRRHVRRVPDPASGELREALREEPEGSGRCALLEGANHCTAYAERPGHCRSFPFWERVLAGGEAFERARAVCPGLAVRPDGETRRIAFAALEELYAELDRVVARSRSVCLARGGCCRFEEAGHELWSTGLEADYAAERGPAPGGPEAPGRCPWHVAGRCTARGVRPLGCRTYFCDPQTTDALEAVHARFLERLRAIERATGYPAAYGRFPDLLRARLAEAAE